MTRSWIVLLRGINVGGKHVVPMRDLKALMAEAGFRNARTYIQSGNIVLEHATRPTDVFSSLIERRFGFMPKVFVMSKAEFGQAITNNPFCTDDGKTVHFFFCDKVPATVDFDLLASLKDDSEDYSLVGKVFYLHAPRGISRSTLVQRLGKAFPGIEMTARNLNTINRLAHMLDNPRG